MLKPCGLRRMETSRNRIESEANRKSPKREWKMLFLPRFRRWLNCSEHVCECSLFHRLRQVRCSSLNKREFGELLVSHLRQFARWNGNGSKVAVKSSARNFHELIRSSSLISIITSKGTKRRIDYRGNKAWKYQQNPKSPSSSRDGIESEDDREPLENLIEIENRRGERKRNSASCKVT